jgi:hypothetical protein
MLWGERASIPAMPALFEKGIPAIPSLSGTGIPSITSLGSVTVGAHGLYLAGEISAFSCPAA